jgi:HlyD family secretion protein
VVQPGTPILELGDPGNLEVVVDLLSRDAVRVKFGAAARITGWGGPPIAARVERVEPSAVTRVSALGIEEQRVTVILTLDGQPEDRVQLGHGFRVIAAIAIWQEDAVLSIPVGALFRDGQDWATYVVRDGRVALQRIEIGERNQAFAQVLGGVKAGDQVILRPSDQVSEGVRVLAAPGQT